MLVSADPRIEIPEQQKLILAWYAVDGFTQAGVKGLLPLDVDSINENDSVANPDPTPRIASVHKSRFAEVVLVGCWIEAVYYGLLLFTMT